MQKWEYKIVVRSRGWNAIGRGEDWHWASDWSAWWEDDTKLQLPVKIVAKLKELGEKGWELVSVTPISSVHGGINPSGTTDFAGFTTEERWVFKRSLE